MTLVYDLLEFIGPVGTQIAYQLPSHLLLITLSSASKKRRGADRELPSNHLILTFHPVRITTLLRPGLKEDFLKHATQMCYPCYPDAGETTLVLGTRPLPVIIFRQPLSSCNIRTITITNYGMKVPFPPATPPSSYSTLLDLAIL